MARRIVLSLALFACPGRCGAEDWPQFRGPAQDGIARDSQLVDRWPDGGLVERWSAPVSEGYSGLVVVGGRLWTMDRAEGAERVWCFDAQTGSVLWRHAYPVAYENSEGNGPRATPTVAGGRVYSMGATAVVHCLDASTGEVHWRKDLLSELYATNLPWGASASPVVVGSRVLLVPGAPNGRCICALDARTGALDWQALDDKAGYATPLIVPSGGRTIAALFTGYALVGLDVETGAERFRAPWQTPHDHNIVMPIHDAGRFFITSGYGTGCALVELEPDGAGDWACRERYRNNRFASQFSAGVLVGGHVYGFHAAYLACVELETGKRRWLERGFGRGSVLAAGGKLIVLGDKGNLALVRPDPDRYDEISTQTVLTGRCWTAPSLAGGRLYVRNQHVLKCLEPRP